MMPRPCRCTRPWSAQHVYILRQPATTLPNQRVRRVPARCHAAQGTPPPRCAEVCGFRATPSCRHRCTTAAGCTCHLQGGARCSCVSAASCERTTATAIDAHMDGIRKHSLHGHDARMLNAAGDHDLHAKAGRLVAGPARPSCVCDAGTAAPRAGFDESRAWAPPVMRGSWTCRPRVRGEGARARGNMHGPQEEHGSALPELHHGHDFSGTVI